MEINKVYQGNCKDLLKEIPNNFIDLTITSPPYDNLRDYEGCKWNMEIFKDIAKELYRVTKEGGVVVWVVGDSTVNGSETGNSFRQALFFKEIGFNLYDTMIYQKKEMPFPSDTRYLSCFEYMFILSKNKPKTINLIKEEVKYLGKNISTSRQKDGSKKVFQSKSNGFRPKFNVWIYGTGYQKTTKDKFAYEHPAMFPEALVKDHIISWSKEGDVILDPFAGSGTTLKIARLLNRNYLGFEISKKYVSLINKRKRQESILAHFDVTQALATQESLNRNLADFSVEKSQIPPK